MRCIQCRRQFSLLEVTVQVDAHDDEGGELCEACDATFPEQFRPSLGGVVAFLNRAETTHEIVPVQNSAVQWTRWPNVKPRAVPAREQRQGPRASRFNDLEQTT